MVSDEEGALAPGIANATSVGKRAGGFWMETLARKGTVPWGDDPNYKVFRNVIDYGADPTGQKDSADAINRAITDGKKCGSKCNGSTVKNAIVYFPHGTYKVTRPILVLFGTQMIGDATNWPLIQASSAFIGLGVMETDKYIGGDRPGPDKLDAEYYVSTASFYRQIRNFKIDITAANNNQNISCGWVWKTTTVKNCNEGFRLASPDGSGTIGSVSFVDSTFTGTKKAIIIGKPSVEPGTNTTGLVLDNIVIDGTIEDVTGKQYLGPGSYESWVFGPTYSKDGKRSFVTGETMEYARQSSLQGGSSDGLPLNPYYERQRPQYTDKGTGDFIHMKDYAKGDGSTDDTNGVQNAFDAVTDGNKILYVDAGTYLIGDTVTIPKDAKIVGETWAQFAAFGQKFSDPKNPRVMLKVGNAKDIGSVEMQDLILTTKGATAGAILMEWNVQAKTQGSAALFDVHARIGGVLGTGLTEKECPSSQTDPKGQCQAASLVMHLTQDASGYFDNMWLWTADHNIDDPNLDDAYNDMPFTSAYTRNSPVQKATNIPVVTSLGLILQNSHNIHIGGAGTYSWFSYYTQECIDLHTCQNVLWYAKDNFENVRVQHIIGIGAKYVLVSEGKGILATDNLAMKEHPAWAQISIFDAPSKGKDTENPDSPDVCDLKDGTYDPNDVPDRLGEYRDPIFETSGDAPWPEVTFITIMNLTPYRFKFRKDLSNQCQINGDFGDVPAGHARQMRAEYDTKEANEDYYYRTIWDMSEWGLGYKEYKNPAAEVAVNFVITGREEYGYYTSMDWASSPQGWMQALRPVIKDRQLRHVVMPGTHDSGMGRWTHSWGGVPANSQSQGLNFYEQLVAGARWFDLRVVEYRDNNQEYLAVHVINELSGYVMGGGGEKLEDIINGINRFTTETPGEAIFLWVRYLNRLSNALVGHKADTRLMNIWFDKFKLINNRCNGLNGFDTSPKMDKRNMSEFMDNNNGKGCVIIIFDTGDDIEPGAPKALPEEGIYETSNLSRYDHWSNTNDDEIPHKDDGSDRLLISQWLLTGQGADAAFGPSLDRAALYTVNQLLYVVGVNAMSPDSYPSVLMVDYFGAMYVGDYGSWDVRDPSLRTLAIGLNLYMASQNCNVSSVKNPLLNRRADPQRLMTAASADAAAGRPQQWNGVIFAKGTRFDEPPPGFSPMYPPLEPGTKFMNGSVVEPPIGGTTLDC
ncbi:hypothetical protein GE09DRAFT_1213862 [Coniochaeta sp. 2T2.1]|nr:hypothetical protein GE09DRAFT_1213862 [Coniochaeta sp. 2T2.1]